MRRFRFLGVATVTLILLGLAGYFGWSSGYEAGLANGLEGGDVRYVGGYGPFLGIALFFKFLLFLFFFLIVFKVLGFMFWRRGGGHRGGRWGKWGEGHGGYGPGGFSHDSFEGDDAPTRV